MSKVHFAVRAAETLEELPPDLGWKTIETLEAVEERPEEVLEESQEEGLFEVEVGDHLVVVDWDRDGDLVTVLSIGKPRGPA